MKSAIAIFFILLAAPVSAKLYETKEEYVKWCVLDLQSQFYMAVANAPLESHKWTYEHGFLQDHNKRKAPWDFTVLIGNIHRDIGYAILTDRLNNEFIMEIVNDWCNRWASNEGL